MWNNKSKGSQDITMTEGDFGVQLPFIVKGLNVAPSDFAMFTFKTEKNGEAIFTKEYTNIAGNTIDFSLTAAESSMLPVGNYLYTVDLYDGNGVFMCNAINNGKLKVEDKV